MLEVGAARIAPPAENHSAVMRLLARAVGSLVALATQLLSSPIPRRSPFDGLRHRRRRVRWLPLCEQPRWIPSLFRPVRARGVGRGGWWGGLLYPGWHTGFLFTLAMFAAFGALLAYQRAFSIRSDDRHDVFVALVGTLAAAGRADPRVLPRSTDRAVALFFARADVSSVLATIFCMVCDNALKTSFKEVVSFLPLSALVVLVRRQRPGNRRSPRLAVAVTDAGEHRRLLRRQPSAACGRRGSRKAKACNLPAPPKSRSRPSRPPPDAPLA